jgi:hypothetical protein
MLFTNCCRFILRCLLILWRNIISAILALSLLGAELLLPAAVSVALHYRAFSAVQKYWFPTYLRTEFSLYIQRTDPLLLVEAANGEVRLAATNDVIPGHTVSDGSDIPFALAPRDQAENKRLVVRPPSPQPNDCLWESLRSQVYGGEAIDDMAARGLLLGLLLALATGFAAFFILLNRIAKLWEWYYDRKREKERRNLPETGFQS